MFSTLIKASYTQMAVTEQVHKTRRRLGVKAAREKALAALKKKRKERKRKEAQVQQSVQQMEAARVQELEAKAAREKALAALKKQEEVESYAWIKQSQGYQCAGGGHFISNDQLGIYIRKTTGSLFPLMLLNFC
ncbi:hypothetical protein F4604DRAFT_1954013 [Suillus subluteus]|nr:hypothetical protein F4604DRAFT_1954013 [Suillus subluteus]